MKLTIGMACHRDFDGVYFTVNALRLMHPEVLSRCELVVVDNDPHGPQAPRLRGFLSQVHNGSSSRSGRHAHPYSVKYISMTKGGGTTQPREEIFRQATGDAVLVLDCHVLLWPGAVAKLLSYYEDHPNTGDILSGPLFFDDHNGFADHFQNQWRDGMWGTWGVIWRSPEGRLVSTRENSARQLVLCDPMTRVTLKETSTSWAGHESWLSGQGYHLAIDEESPFEIPAMGLGCFSSARKQWAGFNPYFREFGGEEWYIHEKVRQRGGKAICLPFLKWQHRFGDPAGGRAHHYTTLGKVRNYVIGLQELRLPLDRLRRHFVEGLNEEDRPQRIRETPLTPEQFEQLALNPRAYPPLSSQTLAIKSSGCLSCGENPERTIAQVSEVHSEDKLQLLDNWYSKVVNTPSDINQHCEKLRELASQSEIVIEFGMRHGVSTVALLAGQPKRLLSYDLKYHPVVESLKAVQGRTDFSFQIEDSRTAKIPECDLLFIDTVHTAEQLKAELFTQAPRVRQRIALHDTEIFGEIGADGNAGLLVALRHFLQVHPEWSVIYHSQANHGLTVISRDLRDKPQIPGSISMAKNFIQAISAHIADGAQKAEEVEYKERLEACMLCDQRADNRCTVCGCFITSKARWSEQRCPLGKWITRSSHRDMDKIPCYVTIRDLITWPQALCKDLVRLGFRVILMDHGSTLPELLEWYENCPYEVRRFANHSCHGFWRRRQHLLENGWYAVTDCDLDLSGVPSNFLEVAQLSFLANPWATKVGVSLELSDVPEDSLARDCIKTYELKYWKDRTKDGHWNAAIDTTFALYHSERNQMVDTRFYKAVRLDRPYTARHLPWYLIPESISTEFAYYRQRCDNGPVYTNHIKREIAKMRQR